MRVHRGIGSAVLAAIACMPMLAGPATDARGAEPIATVASATPLSGGDGWLVWSAPVPGGWGLMGSSGGVVRQLPVSARSQPFDANVGTDAAGAPVVVFSRCTRTPEMSTLDGDAGGAAGGTIVEPETGRGCRIAMLELGSGELTAPPIPVRAGDSDTTPAIWKGTITFARHDPRHGDVWQVLSWSPRETRRVRALPHGRIPSCPELPGGCTRPAKATVDALSSDGAIVAFLWKLPMGTQGIIGEGAWELRIDKADGSAGVLADGNFGHEACMSPESSELEYVWPEPPVADGATALLPELDVYDCFSGFASVLDSHGATRGHGRKGNLGAIALAVARDEGRMYGLVPPARAPNVGDSPGCTESDPCRIEQIAAPVLRRDARLPFVPFQ